MKNIKHTYLIFCLFSCLFFLPTKSDQMFNLGKTIFLGKGNCVSCHTLRDAVSSAIIGPNLNELKPIRERVVEVVTNGISMMPPYEGMLSKKEIQAVAYYVSKSSH